MRTWLRSLDGYQAGCLAYLVFVALFITVMLLDQFVFQLWKH